MYSGEFVLVQWISSPSDSTFIMYAFIRDLNADGPKFSCFIVGLLFSDIDCELSWNTKWLYSLGPNIEIVELVVLSLPPPVMGYNIINGHI